MHGPIRTPSLIYPLKEDDTNNIGRDIIKMSTLIVKYDE